MAGSFTNASNRVSAIIFWIPSAQTSSRYFFTTDITASSMVSTG